MCSPAVVTCPICNKDVLFEDMYQCEKCRRSVCVDCTVNMSNNNTDDLTQWCKDCVNREGE